MFKSLIFNELKHYGYCYDAICINALFMESINIIFEHKSHFFQIV